MDNYSYTIKCSHSNDWTCIKRGVVWKHNHALIKQTGVNGSGCDNQLSRLTHLGIAYTTWIDIVHTSKWNYLI